MHGPHANVQPDVQPSGPEAVPDSHGLNLYHADPQLARLLRLYLPADLWRHLTPHLTRLGALAGGQLATLAALADANPPRLIPRTRRGEDYETIAYHPAYREMARIAFVDYGLAALSHRGGVLGWPEPLPPAAKYALTYLFVQAEFGLCCPVSMTDSLARTLRRFGPPELIARYLPALTAQDLDTLSQGAMFMTEQGAGSDIANITTRAVANGDGTFSLYGEKWFCSNPDAELAMVLARLDGAPAGIRGVSLFLLPRHLPDGTRNRYRILRLKDKLGSRSIASGEIRLEGAKAWLIGNAGAGMRQMADMVNNSRLSNGVRAAGMMRKAVTEALFIAHRRIAFGSPIVDFPLLRRQLAKMLVRAEQARSMMFQAAEALRRADEGDAHASAVVRILTPLFKFRACRDARTVTGDAMEVRGGCGYTEEFADARLVRDAHLGSIWEGTSNIVALDVLRAAEREGALAALADHLAALRAMIRHPPPELAAATARAFALAEAALAPQRRLLARQAASALYHVTTATALAWEAEAADVPERRILAAMVLVHRVLPRDPLLADDTPIPELLLADPGKAAAEKATPP